MKYGRKYGGLNQTRRAEFRGTSTRKSSGHKRISWLRHEIRVGRNGATSGSETISVKLTWDFVAQPQNYPCVSRISWHVCHEIPGRKAVPLGGRLVILA
jgi:hypothetical protein